MAGVYLQVDASSVNSLTKEMGKKLTAENFDRLMRRTLNEVGRHTKVVTRKEIVAQYEVKSGWVASAIGSPKITGGGGFLTCTIPLAGERGKIGGAFSATGGFYGWNPPAYPIGTAIVRGASSTLPARMTHQGGQPPFRNIGAAKTRRKNGKIVIPKRASKPKQGSKLGSLTWTRTSSNPRSKIVPVAGLAVPQMPLNRARPGVEREIVGYLEARVQHNFEFMFGG